MSDVKYRILFIPGGAYPSNSGPGNFLKWTADGLARNGQHVTIISQVLSNDEIESKQTQEMNSSCGQVLYVKSRIWQF